MTETTTTTTTSAVRCPVHGVDGLAQADRVEKAQALNRREVCNLVTRRGPSELCGITVALGVLVESAPTTFDYRETQQWHLGAGWVDADPDQTYGRYQCRSCRTTATLAHGITGPDCGCGAYDWTCVIADVRADYRGPR